MGQSRSVEHALCYNALMDKLLLVLSAIAFAFLVAMMFLFSPSEVGPVGVLVFFTMCYVLFLGLAVSLCRLFFTLRAKIDKTKSGNIKRKSYYYGLVVALSPILWLMCGSVMGSVGLKVGVILAVEILMCFLVSRNIL